MSLLKIVLVGDSGVGKTELLRSFTGGAGVPNGKTISPYFVSVQLL